VGHPVFSPSGDLVEYVGTVIDITERKRADEERERLRQVQADLAHLSRVTTMGELTHRWRTRSGSRFRQQ